MPFTQQSLQMSGLKTGDLLLFSGSNTFSKLIEEFTNSYWSHVGLVVVEEDKIKLFEASGDIIKKNLESTTFITPLSKHFISGEVQLIPLDEALNNFDGNFKVRRLKQPLNEQQLLILDTFIKRYLGTSYEQNMFELLKAAIDVPGAWLEIPIIGSIVKALTLNKRDLTSLFCSEVIVEAYSKMDFRRSSFPSNEFTPKDLSSESGYPLFGRRGIFNFEEEIYMCNKDPYYNYSPK